jgi:predicted thioesterase
MALTGVKGTAQTTVTPDKTAKAMGSGDLPVFATPAMIALMEEAAAFSLTPHLADGATSVGVAISIKHLAATPVGGVVRAESTVTESQGRSVTFSVQVFDEKGLIGEGTHERVIVDAERFLAKAEARK